MRSNLLVGGLVVATICSTYWFRVNLSPSVPRGVYRLTALPETVTRGTLVLLPVPPSVQAFHSSWVPLLKPVAAVAGEAVCVWPEAVWIAGQNYGPAYAEAHGKTLPQVHGCFVVEEGEVFLASAAPKSLDSRYFSSVPVTTLAAQATPLFTWR